MADNIPNVPAGAVPPKKETGKVQPKKETVRINLPPKPSAAPTIKLPTLPPGGPTGAAGTAPAPAAAPAPAHSTAAAPSSVPRTGAAAPIAQRAAAPQRRVTAPVVAAPALSPVDKGLAIAAAVVGLLAAGTTAYVAFMVLQ
jgi:hypothetical protein